MDDQVTVTPASLAEFKRSLDLMKSQLVARLSADSMKKNLEALKLTGMHLPTLKFMPDPAPTLDAICSYGILPAETYVCVISIVIAMLTNEKDRSPGTCTGIVSRMVKYLVSRAPNHADVSYILFLFRHMVCSSRKKQYRRARVASSRWTTVGANNGNRYPRSNTEKREESSVSNYTVTGNGSNSNGSFNEDSNVNYEEDCSSPPESNQGMVSYYDAHKMSSVFKDWPLIEGRIRGFMVQSMHPVEIRRLAVEEFKVAVPLTDEDFVALGAIPSHPTHTLAQAMQTLLGSKNEPADNQFNTSPEPVLLSNKPSLIRVDWEKLFNNGTRLEFKVPFRLIPMSADDAKSRQDNPCRIIRDGLTFVSASELPGVLEAFFVAEIEADLFGMCDQLSAFPFFHHQVLPTKFFGVLFTWEEDMKMYKNLYALLQREELFEVEQVSRVHCNNRGPMSLSSVMRHINALPLCVKLLIERLRSENQIYKLGHFERMDLVQILRTVGVTREEAIVLFRNHYRGDENMSVTIGTIYSAANRIIPPACKNLAGKGMCPFASGNGVHPLIKRDIEDSMKDLAIGFTRQPEKVVTETGSVRVLDFKDLDVARVLASVKQQQTEPTSEQPNPFLLPSSSPVEKCRMVTELKINPFVGRPSLVYNSPVGAINSLKSTLL